MKFELSKYRQKKMIRLLIILFIILIILLVMRSRVRSNSLLSKNFYKKFIIGLIIIGLIFFMATSGKFIIPQILNILKFSLPFLTKFIGI